MKNIFLGEVSQYLGAAMGEHRNETQTTVAAHPSTSPQHSHRVQQRQKVTTCSGKFSQVTGAYRPAVIQPSTANLDTKETTCKVSSNRPLPWASALEVEAFLCWIHKSKDVSVDSSGTIGGIRNPAYQPPPSLFSHLLRIVDSCVYIYHCTDLCQ